MSAEKTDTQRRSLQRQAGVLVRMSQQQRENLQIVACAQGKTVNDFVLEVLHKHLSTR